MRALSRSISRIALHARDDDQHAVLDRQRAAGQPGAGAAGHPRHPVAARTPGRPPAPPRRSPGSTAAAGVDVVLQQPVGLVGPQLVLGRVDPVVAADRAQLADQRRDVAGCGGRLRRDGGALWGGVYETIHDKHRRGLQVHDDAHDEQEQEAPADHPAEEVAFLARQPHRGRADGEVLGRDHLAQHAAGGVRRGQQRRVEARLLGRRDLQDAEQRVRRRVRAGHGGADPADDRREEARSTPPAPAIQLPMASVWADRFIT